jgi:putative transcriptional regulator
LADSLKNRLKVLRAELDITQDQLARKIGVSRLAIHNIERGKSVPSVGLALRLSRFFQVPVERIFTLEESS